MPLSQNRRNSLPWNLRQRSCNKRLGVCWANECFKQNYKTWSMFQHPRRGLQQKQNLAHLRSLLIHGFNIFPVTCTGFCEILTPTYNTLSPLRIKIERLGGIQTTWGVLYYCLGIWGFDTYGFNPCGVNQSILAYMQSK